MNKVAKTSTIFIVIASLLLISLTAISLFFFQKEVEQRRGVEVALQKSQDEASKLRADLTTSQKQITILEAKAKESDDKINSLLDELDLQEGLRDELKQENKNLSENLDKTKKIAEELQKQLTEQAAQVKSQIDDLQAQLKEETAKNEELARQKIDLDRQAKTLKERITMLGGEYKLDISEPTASEPQNVSNGQSPVDLEKIVVGPQQDSAQGRVLSVDTETEFLIFNLGEKDGVQVGNILSVFRGNEYLGDVKVSRVHSEMSAADFIPPFSSRRVRKNDQVVVKK